MSVRTWGGLLVKPGDFAAVHTHDSATRWIDLGETLNGDGFRHYEHAIFYVGGPRDLILEAEGSGAKLVPLHYSAVDLLWSTVNPALNLSDEQRAKAPVVASRYVGIGYSFLDYGALAAHRLGLPVPGLAGYIASTGHMICSQLADQCRLDLGSHLFTDNRWPGYVTPLALADLIRQ